MAKILCGDSKSLLSELGDSTVQCCVTSPPYWNMRDYGVEGQLGQEDSPEEYVEHMVSVFREVRRVLRKDGTLWLNLGDTYAGSGKRRWIKDGKPYAEGKQATNKGSVGVPVGECGIRRKNLVGIPWRVAFSLQADGWNLRQDIIWAKPNPMPESVKDRCTRSHEYLFLLTKSDRYYYDNRAILEPYVSAPEPPRDKASENYNQNVPIFSDGKRSYYTQGGRNKRDVWTIPLKPYGGAHFAAFPEALVEPCVLAGSRESDLVMDPFCGAGTVGVVCKRLGREFVGIEINPQYVEMANERIAQTEVMLEGFYG